MRHALGKRSELAIQPGFFQNAMNREITVHWRCGQSRDGSHEAEESNVKGRRSQCTKKAIFKPPLTFDPNTGSFLENKDLEKVLGAFVIIDPFCNFLGQYLSTAVRTKGYASIEVISNYLMNGLGLEELEHLRVPLEGEEIEWASELCFPIVAVLSESDAGLETAERIQVALGVNGNGMNPARRNKFLMNEVIKSCGLRTVNQVLASSWGEAQSFLDKLKIEKGRTDCIVKPIRGCSSSNVFYCKSDEEAREKFFSIFGTNQYAGGMNENVLVQECLEGQEYAVDTVSCEGVHKIVALWKYDKRSINGAPFVYFSTELIPVSDRTSLEIIEYTKEILDSLAMKFGPAHTEIIMTKAGPTLVEMNGRWHLADVAPLTNACVGYNSVDLTVTSFTNQSYFNEIPSHPSTLEMHGRVVHLVSHVQGKLNQIQHLDEIKSLGSVHSFEIFPEFQIGNNIFPTIDIKTDAGVVLLLHQNKSQIDTDYNRILELQKTMFSIV